MCGVIILFLFAPFLPYSEEITALVWLLLFSLIPYAFHTEWIFWETGLSDLTKYKSGSSNRFCSNSIWYSTPDDLKKLPIYYGLSVGLASLLLWTVSMYKRYLVISPPPDPDLFGRIYSILRESLQLGIGWVGSQIIILFPPLIFALLYSEAFVGWYGVALRIIMLFMVCRPYICAIITPKSGKWLG